MSKPQKVVLFGYGNMGKNHARVLSENSDFELIKIVDPTQSSVTSNKQTTLLSATISDTELNQADAFIIAAATESHYELAKKLIPLKKPILIEKPVASTVAKANELISLAETHRTPVRVGHIERFNPAIKKLKEVIDSGWLGKVIHIAFTRVGGYPQNVKPENNVLIDLAIHDLDLLNWLIGPAKIKGAVTHASLNPNILDTAEILAETNSGTSASFHVNWITPTKIRNARITGTKGVCFVDYILQTCSLLGGNLLDERATAKSDFHSLVAQYKTSDKIEFGVIHKEPLKLELEEFLNLIQQRPDQLCTLEQATHALKIASEALKKSEGAH